MNRVLILFCLLYASHVKAQDPKEVLTSIYFGGGSYGIDRVQAEKLWELVKSIPNIEYYEVKIASHTDNIGGREFNEYLSHMRSQAVINLLVHLKVPEEIIKYRDFAYDNPVFDNASWEGRFKNRRVDILFVPIPF